MPIYDYFCLDCQQRFDVFLTYAEYGKRAVACPHCKSKNVRRRIPRVRVAKSEDSRLDSLSSDFSDPSALAGLENDPRAMGRMMRKMSREMDEDMGPEFDDVIDRLEAGQSPEEIEQAIPGLGEGGLGDDGGFAGGDDF